MSILIKGMEMPQSCWRCPLCLTVDPDTYRCMPTGQDFESSFDAIDHIVLSCPLVEIPPHGRLIDENDVMKSAEELRKSPWYNDEPYHAMRKDGLEMAIDMAVKDAPTIIEAEGVK